MHFGHLYIFLEKCLFMSFAYFNKVITVFVVELQEFFICSRCVCVHALSRVWLFVTPRTVARQAPLSLGFSGKNIGVGCHILLQGIFATQGLNLNPLCLLLWQGDSLPQECIKGSHLSIFFFVVACAFVIIAKNHCQIQFHDTVIFFIEIVLIKELKFF